LACYFFSVFLTTRLCCLELSIVLNTLMECSFSCFLLSNLISLRIFLFKITFSKVSLFLLRTFLLRSGYFYENFDLTWSNLSMNYNCFRSNGAFWAYYFKKITSSFLYFWLWPICFTIRLFSDSTFFLVKGILKLVLCLLFFFLSLLVNSAFFLS
jgi:hypothetical protein